MPTFEQFLCLMAWVMHAAPIALTVGLARQLAHTPGGGGAVARSDLLLGSLAPLSAVGVAGVLSELALAHALVPLWGAGVYHASFVVAAASAWAVHERRRAKKFPDPVMYRIGCDQAGSLIAEPVPRVSSDDVARCVSVGALAVLAVVGAVALAFYRPPQPPPRPVIVCELSPIGAVECAERVL